MEISKPIAQAMLMSAGLGQRLRPFTQNFPKALVPVMGIPVAQYAIDSLISSGVKRIVANVHHQAERARTGLTGLTYSQDTQLLISDESECLLGSSGGLKKALPLFEPGPFFLANADVISDMDWEKLAAHHAHLRKTKGVSITLALFPSGPTGGVYTEVLFDLKTNLITGLGQKSEKRPFFTGAAVIEPEALEGLPLGTPTELIPEVLLPAIAAGKAGAFITDGLWFDIGEPALWLAAHMAFTQKIKKSDLHSSSSLRWWERMRGTNEHLSNGVWVSKESLENTHYKLPVHLAAKDWTGPCYWDGRNSEFCPKILGPKAVLYGDVPNQEDFKSGIGFDGKWMNSPEKT